MFTFRKREREGERKGEKHQSAAASPVHPDWGQNPQPRQMLNQELNWQCFALCDDIQPAEPHWSGHPHLYVR